MSCAQKPHYLGYRPQRAPWPVPQGEAAREWSRGLSSVWPSLTALPGLQEMFLPITAAAAPASLESLIVGLKVTKALVAPRVWDSKGKASQEGHGESRLHPWSPNSLGRPPRSLPDNSVRPYTTDHPSEPYSSWRAIWEFKQPACHELGLRVQQPGTVFQPLSTPRRPQRPEKWWGIRSCGERHPL